MRIYLIGYMGSGKTTFGKHLARELGYPFLDLDHYLEKGYGKTIPEIFQTEGESRFRELEKEYLQRTAEFDNHIISCGGGTPCFFDNMEWINKNGVSVYLKMSVGGLVNRLKNAKEERPLLKGMNEEEMKEFISRNLALREPFYSKAQYILNGENVSAATLLNAINNQH